MFGGTLFSKPGYINSKLTVVVCNPLFWASVLWLCLTCVNHYITASCSHWQQKPSTEVTSRAIKPIAVLHHTIQCEGIKWKTSSTGRQTHTKMKHNALLVKRTVLSLHNRLGKQYWTSLIIGLWKWNSSPCLSLITATSCPLTRQLTPDCSRGQQKKQW